MNDPFTDIVNENYSADVVACDENYNIYNAQCFSVNACNKTCIDDELAEINVLNCDESLLIKFNGTLNIC